MKIVHIALRSPYTDNWGYQENILPRVQCRVGDDVTVIADCSKFNSDGNIVATEPAEYTLSDGVKVIRVGMSNRYRNVHIKKLYTYYEIFPILCELNPDVIFVHCLGAFKTNSDIIKYIKHNHKCILFGDTHEFEEISNPLPKSLKGKFIKLYQKNAIKKLYPYYRKIYGITPNCIEYAIKYYNAPPEKMELLPLGYDPILTCWNERESIRKSFREKYGISENDVVIVHGGKIEYRRRTPYAIEAVKRLNNKRVKLVIFGGLSDDMKMTVSELINDNKSFIIYLGKLSQREYYDAFLSSDIGLFPGGQSVLWQEAIGCGLPLVLGKAKDIEYLNIGGNVTYVKGDSASDILSTLKDILDNSKYIEMKNKAVSSAREFFSYERIAKQIVSCVNEVV